MADNIDQLYGDYGSNVIRQFVKTPREGLSGLADTVNYAAGCTGDHCTRCQVGYGDLHIWVNYINI